MKTIWNMKPKARRSKAHLEISIIMNSICMKTYEVKVSDKIFMVLLKEMYLKTLIQTKNTLIPKIMVWYSDHSPKSVKSPKDSGSANSGWNRSSNKKNGKMTICHLQLYLSELMNIDPNRRSCNGHDNNRNIHAVPQGFKILPSCMTSKIKPHTNY